MVKLLVNSSKIYLK